MTDSSKRSAPCPLRGEHELGALLREANEQYAAGLDEAAAYRRIQEQLPPASARGPALFGGRFAAALGALAFASALVWLKTSSDVGSSIRLGPEDHAGTRAAPSLERARVPTAARWAEAAAPEAPEPRQVITPRDTPAAPLARPEQPKPKRVRQLQEDQLPEELPRPHAPREEALEDERETEGLTLADGQPKEEGSAPELDCMQMARDGEPRQAESCFVTLASGVGLRAEMALHEVARLRRDVLGDASGALAALSEYRQRFPRGSLSHEVALSRVELLGRLGRTRDALQESEELLSSPDGRARAAELHVLRGNMYRTTLSDLRAAATEFARAERLGGALGAEATYLRGTCLEALGDERAALEAYERYMSTPRRPRSAEVSRRIAALSAAQASDSAGPEETRRPRAQ